MAHKLSTNEGALRLLVSPRPSWPQLLLPQAYTYATLTSMLSINEQRGTPHTGLSAVNLTL